MSSVDQSFLWKQAPLWKISVIMLSKGILSHGDLEYEVWAPPYPVEILAVRIWGLLIPAGGKQLFGTLCVL